MQVRRLALNHSHIGIRRFEAYVFKICVVAVVFTLIGCNAMHTDMMNSNRVLTSMTISPPAANAQNFMNGQVQFTATGTFSKPPSPAPVTFTAPFSGSWNVSDTNTATITQTGMAQCMHSGMVTVTAIASSNSATMPGAMSTAVTATATLTCP